MAGTVAPLPSVLQRARGRGGGKGTHQYWAHTPLGPRRRSDTRPRPPGGHLCSWGREEGGGKEEGSRLGQQAPQPPLEAQGMSPGLRHTPWSTPQLSHRSLGDHGPPPPLCKGRLNSACPAAVPSLPGINETAHVVPFISGKPGRLDPGTGTAGPERGGPGQQGGEAQGPLEASTGRHGAGPGGFLGSSLTTPPPSSLSQPPSWSLETGLHTVIRAVVAMTTGVDFVSIFSPPACKERESPR